MNNPTTQARKEAYIVFEGCPTPALGNGEATEAVHAYSMEGRLPRDGRFLREVTLALLGWFGFDPATGDAIPKEFVDEGSHNLVALSEVGQCMLSPEMLRFQFVYLLNNKLCHWMTAGKDNGSPEDSSVDEMTV